MIKSENLKNIALVLPASTSFFFLFQRGLSTAALYIACVMGLILTIFSNEGAFKKKESNISWTKIIIIACLIPIVSLVFYAAAETPFSYLDSPYSIVLTMIPFVIFLRVLDKEELLIYILIILFISSGVISHWLGSQDDYGARVISSRYFKLLYFAPLLVAFKWMNIDWKNYILIAFVGVIGSAFVTVFSYCCIDLANGYLIDKFTNSATVSGNTNPIFFGIITLSLSLSIFLAMWFNFFGAKYFLILLIAFAMGLIGVLNSGSRGVWIALVLILLLYVIFYASKANVSGYKKIGTVIAAMIIGLILFNTQIVEQRVSGAFSDIKIYMHSSDVHDIKLNNSLGTRFELWKSAIKIFKQHWLFGVGPGNFKSEINRLADKGELNSDLTIYNQAHNQYFHTLATRGVVGMLMLAALCMGLLWVFVRRMKALNNRYTKYIASCGATIMLCYINLGLTESPFERRSTIVFFTFFIALSVAAMKQLEVRPARQFD